jgi:vacuolar-type H+-ATPase subunit H
VSSSDRPVKRQQIEDSTAARLAEIVAAAERAARQVIDEAEAEARARLSDAHEEADRIVAERLAGLAALTDEIGAQAEALRSGAEALQAALARAKMEVGVTEIFGGSTAMRRPEAAPRADEQKSAGPSLTVVGTPGHEPAPDLVPAPESPPGPTPGHDAGPAAAGSFVAENLDVEPPSAVGTPAGARLLATQMAVSGSSREEIESRLRSGFAIADTRPILDAILGPEQ